MKQQIDVYVKLCMEADASHTRDAMVDLVSNIVIGGLQVFADVLTAPVEIIDIVEEAQIIGNECPAYDAMKETLKRIAIIKLWGESLDENERLIATEGNEIDHEGNYMPSTETETDNLQNAVEWARETLGGK